MSSSHYFVLVGGLLLLLVLVFLPWLPLLPLLPVLPWLSWLSGLAWFACWSCLETPLLLRLCRVATLGAEDCDDEEGLLAGVCGVSGTVVWLRRL